MCTGTPPAAPCSTTCRPGRTGLLRSPAAAVLAAKGRGALRMGGDVQPAGRLEAPTCAQPRAEAGIRHSPRPAVTICVLACVLARMRACMCARARAPTQTGPTYASGPRRRRHRPPRARRPGRRGPASLPVGGAWEIWKEIFRAAVPATHAPALRWHGCKCNGSRVRASGQACRQEAGGGYPSSAVHPP